MILETINLTKIFGGLTALDEVSLKVPNGAIYGLIGPNGAGKTTFFNLITGLLSKSRGEVLFQGKDISNLKPHQIAQNGISRTYQNLALFPTLTVEDHILIATIGQEASVKQLINLVTSKYPIEAEQYVNQILDLLELEHKRHFLASNLSYGESRRLEVARALGTKPKLLILDEPAAGMNETETVKLKDYLKEIKRWGITVLLIEHDMKLVMDICEEIAVLNFGKQIAQGAPSYVQKHPQVVSAYLGGD